MLSFFIFVLNLAVTILELTASQLMNARCESFNVGEEGGGGGGRSLLHGLSTELFLLLTVSFVLSVHQTKQVISSCHLRCLPCFIHCADVPGGELGGCLGCQKGVGLAASIRLSLQCIILPLGEGPSTPKSDSLGFVAEVSGTDLVFPVKGSKPYPSLLASRRGGPF